MKRWSIEPTRWCGMLTLESADGQWVRYEDVAALQERINTLENDMTRMVVTYVTLIGLGLASAFVVAWLAGRFAQAFLQ
jgi:hypothetical protein